MSRSTISTFRLFELFPDEEAARLYLEDRLWPNGPICPACKSGERLTTRKNGFYRCNACQLDFTIRTGTIFGRSHIPLHKWVYAMYLLVTARKGISSLQLGKEIGVSQKSAWFMLQRLREACSSPDSIDKLKGIIEIDECFLEGKTPTSPRTSARDGAARLARQPSSECGSAAGDRVRYDEAKTREERMKNVPTELDAIADVALNYRPKKKAKKLRPRKRKKTR